VPQTLVVHRDGSTTATDAIVLPGEGETIWIDLLAPSESDLQELRATYKFHPVTIDDVRTYDQRPKLEEYGDHLFVVIHRLMVKATPCEVESDELHAFIGRNFLVTAHARELPELTPVFSRLAGDPLLAQRGPAFWLYLVSSRLAMASGVEIENLAAEVEAIEERVFEVRGQQVLEQMLHVKRALATARRLTSPQRDVFAALTKLGSTIVPDNTAVYFRDVYDQYVRELEALDSQRELAGSSLEAYFSMVSQRTNEVMKHLTLLSSIFLPLTFVTGFFGQNFEHLPFHSDLLMWIGITSCLLLPAGMLSWFRLKRWL
jgi:magnesium transporter